MNELPEWLNEEIQDRGWSIRELARRAGITHAAISHVLNGSRQPGSGFCTAIARALQLPAEEVFRRAGLLPRLEVGAQTDVTIQTVMDRLKYLTAEERQEVLELTNVVYRRKHKGL